MAQMFQKFKQNLSQQPNWMQQKYLLAISGGIDSVVLAELFKRAGLKFSMAHCNFKLRGADSDADQAFVTELAAKFEVPLHINICDLSQSHENIQLAARNQRYEWFKKLRIKHQYNYLVTGHHLNDSLESFLLNLQRGTGLKGLLGIQNNDFILRPLQNFSRKEIQQYAHNRQLQWREDRSNASEKYRRNFIRHQIVPPLVKNNPAFYNNFNKTLQYLQQTQKVVDDWFKKKLQQLVISDGTLLKLNIEHWKKLSSGDLFLYQWLSPYGFTDHEAIIKLTGSQSGKQVVSPTHILYKDRDFLILQKKHTNTNKDYKINFKSRQELADLLIEMHLLKAEDIDIDQIKQASKDEIYVDFNRLNFPLTLRKWQKGDSFYPLGMTGKKKLSNYFIDEKLSLPEKEKIWLLCHQKDIIWLVGKRLDKRYKIQPESTHVLHIKIKNQKQDI